MSKDKPTTPLQMIMTAAYTVSLGRVGFLPPSMNMMDKIKAVSMTVTASASTKVP